MIEAKDHPQIGHYVVTRIRIENAAPPLEIVGHLRVGCANCNSYFIVKLSWVKGQYRTRPCPYCFKTSWVPSKVPK